jgi:hypothetical protein
MELFFGQLAIIAMEYDLSTVEFVHVGPVHVTLATLLSGLSADDAVSASLLQRQSGLDV